MKIIVLLLSLVAASSAYSLSKDHGKICTLCIATLEEVKSAATSDEVETLCTEVAVTVCAVMPKAHRDDCKKFVSSFMEENFNIIREFTKIWGPEDICQMVMLCPKDNLSAVEGKVCTMCTDSVAMVRFLLTDPTLETMIKTYVETACSVTGSLAPLCMREVGQLVDLVFSEVKTMFDNLKDEDICKAAHMCAHDGTVLYQPFSAAVSSPTPTMCDACTATVNEIEAFMAMDELVKLMEDVSKIACTFLPIEHLTDTCEEMTQDFLDEFFFNLKQFMNDFDGLKICQMTHVCASEDVLTSGLELSSVSPLCDVCEDFLHLTRTAMTNPALETAVNADVKVACAFTGFFHKKCESYVDAFTDAIFGEVRDTFEKFDDHKTCVLFKFCEDTGNKTTVCDVCMDSFGEVSEFMISENLRKLVTDGVDLACRASGPLSRICKEEANKVIDIIFGVIDKVFEIETAERFCGQIHLCKRPALF